MRRHRWSLILLALGSVGLVLWSWLTLGTNRLRWLDRMAPPPLQPDSMAGEIAAAVAVATHPLVLLVALWILAAWAQRRRFRNLTQALLLASVLGWAVPALLKRLIGRPRPAGPFADHFTSAGAAYPSTHATMVVVTALMVGAAAATTRQPRTVQLFWRLLMTLVVVVVSLDRLLMGAHWTTDLVAGWLLGGTITALSSWATGLRTVPAWEIMRPLPTMRQGSGTAAVIYNPAKVTDEFAFRRHVREDLTSRGWEQPLWLTTTPDDPGWAMAAEAIERRVDRVLVAGGDGTVRVVCSAMAHSGIPVALVPAGTANLLAKNLGVPMDEQAALDIAFDGDPYAIDLVSLRLDDQPTGEHFAVMGGIGIDAKVMADTNEDLKRAVKSVAYFLAVMQNVGHRPVEATVTLDGRVVSHRPSSLMLVGNVGEIQVGLQMFPRASASDGLIDVLVSGPRGLAGWLRFALERVYRQLTQNVDSHQGKHVRIEVAEPLPYQLDGDTMGTATVFEAQVDERAVTLMLPRRQP
ncbi:diacylglycerol kinase family protein [Aestuariimicrobium ganziense]|uniref:diacylglycerol kinase family protein n=1 Tax=Aestuariimicrobium ganziense TaxID=2773677 RepID=UPI0019454EBF|nr:diacylglycerol kinase family protein [Aestuariimicrobium ganziense]